MDEALWLACEDPGRMLACLVPAMEDVRRRCGDAGPVGRISDRKLRLWVAAMRDHGGRPYPNVAWAKQWRNGEAGASEGAGHALNVARKWCDREHDRPGDPPMPLRAALLRDVMGNPWKPWHLVYDQTNANESRARGDNWFWTGYRTPPVLSLASAAYENRQPDGTLDPVTLGWLADALEEAGCEDEAILRHLRGEKLHRCTLCRLDDPRHCIACQDRKFFWYPTQQPHVRGCHVVDLILGKE